MTGHGTAIRNEVDKGSGVQLSPSLSSTFRVGLVLAVSLFAASCTDEGQSGDVRLDEAPADGGAETVAEEQTDQSAAGPMVIPDQLATSEPLALSVLGIVLSPSQVSRQSEQVSCNYAIDSGAIPPETQIQFAWRIGDTQVSPWTTPSTPLDTRELQIGALVSCGVRLTRGEEVLSAESWAEATAVLDSPPPKPTLVQLATRNGYFYCEPTMASEDADGQILSPHIQWRQDGVLMDGTQEERLLVKDFPKGAIIQCEVASTDGSTLSDYVASDSLERENISPTEPTSVVLSVQGQMNCSASGAKDSDSDSLVYRFQWLKNDKVALGESGVTFGGVRRKGDRIVCQAQSSDGTAVSDWVSSAEVVVPNAAPSAPSSVSLTPASPYKSSTLTCSASGASDADGDALTPATFWYRNGVLISGAKSSSLTGSQFSKGDRIHCGVSMSDGSASSSTVLSATVTILNSLPGAVAAASITPLQVYANSGSVSCQGGSATDPDGDQLTYEFAWRRNGIVVRNFASGSTYAGPQLAKNDAIACATRAIDSSQAPGPSTWSANLVVANSPPMAPASVNLSPTDLYTSSIPVCLPSASSDIDGDTVAVSYRWRRNGTLVNNQLSATYSGGISKDNTLQCEVSVTDGSAPASPWVVSSPITVRNTNPGPLSLTRLSPSQPTESSVLLCEGSGSLDADGDSLSYRYEWFRNGTVIPGASESTLSGAHFSKGDVLYCASWSHDGTGSSIKLASQSETVLNTAPSAVASVSVAPSSIFATTGQVECTHGSASDLDGDMLNYQYSWRRNGVVQNWTSDRWYSGVALAKGDLLSCGVRAIDSSLDTGSVLWSVDVAVQNSAPTSLTSVSLTPATLTIESNPVCLGVPSGDPDGDALTVLYRWRRNGAIVPGQSSSAFSASLSKGQLIQCEASASDGVVSSAWAPSTALTVQNSAPLPPSSVTLSPSLPNKSSILTCSATGASDVDGDLLSLFYVWRKNGSLIAGAANATLNNSFFSKHDLLSCEVAVSDGSILSSFVASNFVTIENTAPGSAGPAALSPAVVYADTGTLECVSDQAADIDGDELSYEYIFLKNGSIARDWDSSGIFDPLSLIRGESYVCGVRASDDDLVYGPESYSPQLDVQNSGPTVPTSVSLTPAAPIEGQVLQCEALGASDADGDSISYQTKWFKNGTEIAGQTGTTLAADQFTSNDSLVCSAAASDSALVSEFVVSNEVVINAGPSVSLARTEPPSPSTSRVITILGSVSAATSVSIYPNDTCVSAPLATLSASEFEGNGALISLTGSQIYLTFSARAFDGLGNFSSCASGLSYFRQAEKVAEFSDSPAAISLLSSNPGAGVEVGGRYVFAATHPVYGTELWVSDGTPSGTTLLKDINPSGHSNPANLTVIGERAFFSADNGTQGIELWSTDGTEAGTNLVKDIRSGKNASTPAFFSAFGDLLIFAANDGTNGVELWKSDGTAMGTLMVRNINPGNASSNPRNFSVFGMYSYFQAADANGAELWRTDGTSAGTTLVANIRASSASSSPSMIIGLTGVAVFVADDGVNGLELWSTDGTVTSLVRNINGTSASSAIAGMFKHQNEVYFFANDGVNGAELWKSNGTTEGTVLLKNLRSGSSSSQPTTIAMATLGQNLLFSANNGTNGVELFQSDGTSAGTTLLKDIVTGSTSSTPINFRVIGDKMLFQASGELYVTDGSGAGTVLAKDIRTGTLTSAPRNFGVFAGSAIFVADDGLVGSELWSSDGTGPGTVLMRDIYSSGSLTILSRIVTTTNGLAFFVADDGEAGPELWASDGTDTGTYMVKDIALGATGSSITQLTAIDDEVFFSASTAANGAEPWRSDGTSSGTLMLADLATGTASSSPSQFTGFQNQVAFIATGTNIGQEVYVSDGTGASLLRDIRVGTNGSSPTGLTTAGTNLYFSANDGVSGAELWVSNGTSGGTVLLADINAGSASSSPVSLVHIGGKVIFAATTAGNGQELWTSDGTLAGTVLVRDIRSGTGSSTIANMVSDGTKAYFSATNGSSGSELWTSDGSLAGTFQVRDIFAGSTGSAPAQLRFVGSRVFFAATGTTNQGQELWVSDGTSLGTTLVKDINLAVQSGSSIAGAVSLDGRLFFTASDSQNGADLWVSDGTSAGTYRAFDQLYQVGTVTALGTVGDIIIFGGSSPVTGLNSLFRF